jgi:hypothetical protein
MLACSMAHKVHMTVKNDDTLLTSRIRVRDLIMRFIMLPMKLHMVPSFVDSREMAEPDLVGISKRHCVIARIADGDFGRLSSGLVAVRLSIHQYTVMGANWSLPLMGAKIVLSASIRGSKDTQIGRQLDNKQAFYPTCLRVLPSPLAMFSQLNDQPFGIPLSHGYL